MIAFPDDSFVWQAIHDLTFSNCSEYPIWVRSVKSGHAATNKTISKQYCLSVNDEIKAMQMDVIRIVKMVHETISEVKRSTHDLDDLDNDRVKRKLFGFLGEILELITGSPSQKSFDSLKARVQNIENLFGDSMANVSELF